ncbi:MAG: ABC-F family ATP-binding cassette domain-containing protein [Eubacteriaceae bacterium]|nr:ABC-F family ATP-binding cassette domain-containing protein [Eubacteriaceae bacterium]
MIAAFSRISLSFGSQTLFEGVSATVQEGAKIGLVGANGSGKSTLLKIIAGHSEADSGTVSFAEGAKPALLQQESADSGKTVFEEALDAFSALLEEEKALERLSLAMQTETGEEELGRLAASYTRRFDAFSENKGLYFRSFAEGVLKGLGFGAELQQRSSSQLSSGQRMRLSLAKILMSEPGLMLLDEPTNYLDIQASAWLESFLSTYKKAFIVVSHDRYFLDKAASEIWDLENKSLAVYKCGYSSYISQKREREEAAGKKRMIANAQAEKELEIIARLKSFNREKSVKQARSREKKLAKIQVDEIPLKPHSAQINFEAKRSTAKLALDCEELWVGYGGKAVAGPFNFQMLPSDRIGFAAGNAEGKSTFLKTIAGMLAPVSGSFELGRGVNPVYLSHEWEGMDPSNTLLGELSKKSGQDTSILRNLLAGMLFRGEQVYKLVGDLSGGERARMALALAMLQDANLLLLDEPTNHLDIQSKEAFEEALLGYNGAVIVASHDRYLLRAISKRSLFIEDSKPVIFEDGYDAALVSLEQMRQIKAPEGQGKEAQSAKRQPSKPAASKNAIRKAELRLGAIEEEIGGLQGKISEIEEEMLQAVFFVDNSQALAKLDFIEESKKIIAELEDEWIECAHFLESALGE